MNPETTAALVGASIGGAIGFFGTLVRDRLATIWERSNLALALRAELQENRSRFSGFADIILGLGEGEALEHMFTPWSGQQFFPVYDNSTYRLGWFRPDDAAKIVHAVGQFKNLMEHINVLHEREGRYSELITQCETNNRPAGHWVEERRQVHVRDAERLRPVLKQLLEDADQAISALQRYVRS